MYKYTYIYVCINIYISKNIFMYIFLNDMLFINVNKLMLFFEKNLRIISFLSTFPTSSIYCAVSILFVI